MAPSNKPVNDGPHWLDLPELETLIQAASQEPLSLEILSDCVAAIAGALEREVVLGGKPPVVTFHNHHGAFYNVRLHEDAYRVIYTHAVAQLEFTDTRTEQLAWKICGFRCTPAQMRAARERAARDGFTGEVLPNIYFAEIDKPSK